MHARHTTSPRTARALLVVLALASALLVAPPAVAQDRADPELQTTETAAVLAGDTTWVALNWLGSGEATDFSVRVENAIGSNQAEWAYPENTGDFTSLANDATLQDGELDYTAFEVTVPLDQSRNFQLNLRVRWQDGRGNRSELFRVTVPVASFDGEDLEQVTEELEVTRGEDTWVEVKYAGNAPRLEDFSVTVPVDTQGAIVYPGDDDASSLHHDDTLVAEETDVARFLALGSLAGDVEESEFTLPLRVSYTKGGGRITQDFTVTVRLVD